jgi:hypothetical protein
MTFDCVMIRPFVTGVF